MKREEPDVLDPTAIEATQQLVIRRPAEEVFRAFVDPEVTTRFWFGRSTGRLEPGATVEWFFDPHGVSAEVRVVELEPPARLVYDWGSPGGDDFTRVEMTFEPRPDGRTAVRVVNRGFAGEAGEVVARALDSVGGFSLVLAAAKAWLEHGVELRVVADKA